VTKLERIAEAAEDYIENAYAAGHLANEILAIIAEREAVPMEYGFEWSSGGYVGMEMIGMFFENVNSARETCIAMGRICGPIMRRTPATPAGPWMPLEGNNAE
jgi:hypothetical protein